MFVQLYHAVCLYVLSFSVLGSDIFKGFGAL